MISRESPYISNTFSRETPKLQTGFYVSTRSPHHSKECPEKPHKSGDPNILSLVSSESGTAPRKPSRGFPRKRVWYVPHFDMYLSLVSSESGTTPRRLHSSEYSCPIFETHCNVVTTHCNIVTTHCSIWTESRRLHSSEHPFIRSSVL